MRFSPFQRPEHSLNDQLRNRRWGETNKTSSRGWLRTSKDDKDCDSGRIICNWSIHYTLPCSPILKGANLTWRTCKPELLSTFCRAWAAKHKHILHCRWINRDRFAAWLGACLWWAGQRKMMPHGNPGQKHLTHWKKNAQRVNWRQKHTWRNFGVPSSSWSSCVYMCSLCTLKSTPS